MIINILGAGTWGTTIGSLIAKNNPNYKINIWQRNHSKSQMISSSRLHENLSNHRMPENINFTSNFNNLDGKSLTIIAVPTSSISNILSSYSFSKETKFIIACKGFDISSGLLPSQLLEIKHQVLPENISVLSGPNHAEEIIDNKPSAAVIASTNKKLAKDLQKLFFHRNFRVYASTDVMGVQVGAAVKNVIAIASGLCVGLELGDNAQAALVSRGMNELATLKNLYNIKIKSLYGLSGLGDLIATCYSKHSRNRKLGYLIGKGKTLDESKKEIGMVSEGVNTCKILYDISIKHKLDMPICTEVYNILFSNTNPRESIYNLMTRSLKIEY